MFHGIEAKEQFTSWRVEHGTNFCLKQTNKKVQDLMIVLLLVFCFFTLLLSNSL